LSADLSGPATDARAGDITILQLLTMTSGFDPAASGDQILQEAAIQKSLGISTPPQRTDIIRYRLARPLDTAPGAKYAYANFNYLVLGQIIEQASGRPYVAYVNSAIFEKLGVASTDFVGAASLVKDHGPREPNYLCSEKGASVYAPGNTVALNDGYIRADNWVSAGFSVTTSKAMALFGANYQIWGDTSAESPSARTGTALTAPLDQFAAGAWCGTESLLGQRKSGVSYAVLINKSSPASDSNYAGTLKAALDKVLNELRL
jgi:CubicO group peptidase (beta-lactamase class C family)